MTPPSWLEEDPAGRLPLLHLYRALRGHGCRRWTAMRWAWRRTRSEA